MPMPSEFWIVVTEFDCDIRQPLRGLPQGQLVHEGFLHTEEEAKQRAASVNGKYGWAAAIRVGASGY
jgi:hypothetical protein